MPRVGDDALRAKGFSLVDCVTVYGLFEQNRQHGDYQGEHGGTGEFLAVQTVDDETEAVEQHPDADGGEHCPDDEGGKSLEFPVAVGVVAVFWATREFYKDEHNNVGGEIAERVNGIGYHGRATPRDSGDKLDDYQQGIDRAAGERHLVNFFFA